MDCINCETELTNFVVIRDKNGNECRLCKDCLCYECGTNLAERHEEIEIDAHNWIRVKRVHFEGNWISLDPYELSALIISDIVLTCDFCKHLYCGACDSICNDYCGICDAICSECSCAEDL